MPASARNGNERSHDCRNQVRGSVEPEHPSEPQHADQQARECRSSDRLNVYRHARVRHGLDVKFISDDFRQRRIKRRSERRSQLRRCRRGNRLRYSDDSVGGGAGFDPVALGWGSRAAKSRPRSRWLSCSVCYPRRRSTWWSCRRVRLFRYGRRA